MKVLTILGSPNKDGNTATVLSWIENELKSKGHKIKRIDLKDKAKGCRACFTCQSDPDEPNCAVDSRIYERMVESDGVIFASPLFCWGFPAPMKAIIDRSLCMVSGYKSDRWKSLVQGKPFGLVVTGGGPVDGNFDLLREQFRRYSDWTKVKMAGELLVPFCTSPDELSDTTRWNAIEFASRFFGTEEN